MTVAVAQNLEAERALLGGMLLDNRCIPDAAEKFPTTPALQRERETWIGPFSSFANQEIFDAIAALFRKGREVDPLTVGEVLERAGRYQAIGGAPYLCALEEDIV